MKPSYESDAHTRAVQKKKYDVLKQIFGYSSFRPGQEEIIDHILNGRDVLGILPTGGGKSICYQVPALILPGITLVISPLISLMRDQVQALNLAGVHAAFLNSSLSEAQQKKALELASRGRYKLIYVAPERLLTDAFQAFVSCVPISMIAVDEAHCISQWGQDFRPSYRKITEFTERCTQRPIIAAFTATATKRVQEDIEENLKLQNPFRRITGFDRKNLYFAVKKQPSKISWILQYLAEHVNDSGIIYCATRKNVDLLAADLKTAGYNIGKYHAGMSVEERMKNQEDFLYDRVTVMIATNAFGMGIDKSNVRFVIHYSMPGSMENYYQEAGRAGRDGEPAECILLYNGQDIHIQRFLIAHAKPVESMSKEEFRHVQSQNLQRLQAMQMYCFTKGCLRRYILRYFGEDTPESCGNCSFCLGEAETDVIDQYRKDSAIKKQQASVHASLAASALRPEDNALFLKLRALRTELARAQHIPPFLIFSDAALKAMCVMHPVTEKAFLEVPGVGVQKLARYGKSFLAAIHSFDAKESVLPVPSSTGESEGRPHKTANEADRALLRQSGKGGKKNPFCLHQEERSAFLYNDRYTATELAKAMNACLMEKDRLQIHGTTITKKMIELGYAKEVSNGRFSERKVTLSGEKAGLRLAARTGKKGQEYLDIFYDQRAQNMILDLYTEQDMK